MTFEKSHPPGLASVCAYFYEDTIMNGFKTWMRTFRQFGKTETAAPLETEEEEAEEISQYALRMYRLQQLKDLDEKFAVEEKSQHLPEPMNFESAKSHWFEFSSGRQAPQEHQGKQYKITSDTWNRLSASLKTIEERAKEEQAKNSAANVQSKSDSLK